MFNSSVNKGKFLKQIQLKGENAKIEFSSRWLIVSLSKKEGVGHLINARWSSVSGG